MSINSARGRRSVAAGLLLLVLPGIVHGCSAPTKPAPPPGGGQQLVLSFDDFERAVDPVLTRHGCDAGGDCHGGGIRGSLELSPAGAKNARFDFDQVVLQVSASSPGASPILTEPLAIAAGGTPHAFKPFASTDDSDYVAMHEWIMAAVHP